MDLVQFEELVESLHAQVAPLRSATDPEVVPPEVADALTALEQALVKLRLSYEQQAGAYGAGYDTGVLTAGARDEWRALVDRAADGYVLTDVAGVILDANRVATTLFGLRRDELVGKPLATFLPREERRVFAARLLRPPALSEVQEQEMRVVSASQQELSALVTLARLAPFTTGQTDITWIFHDVTPRRRVEEALQAALENVRLGEQRLDEALRLAPVTLFTADQQLQHTLVHGPHLDPAIEALLGSGHNSVPPSAGMANLLGFERAVLDGQVGARGEVGLGAAGGEAVDTAVYYDIAAEPLRDAAGQVIGLSLLLWDATERRLAGEALREAREGLIREVAELQRAMKQSANDLEGSRQKARELSRRLVEVQEQERRALARELHDEAGQVLAALILSLGAIEKEASQGQSISTRVAELKRMTEGAMEALHRVTTQLRPISLDRLGLVAALRQHVESLQGRTNLHIGLVVVGMEGVQLGTAAETAIYRVVQEALTNVVRHASAQQVSLILERHDSVIKAVIEDDGVGFDPGAAVQSGRLGLVGMRERVEMIGGRLYVESVPGKGTTVVAEIPCDC